MEAHLELDEKAGRLQALSAGLDKARADLESQMQAQEQVKEIEAGVQAWQERMAQAQSEKVRLSRLGAGGWEKLKTVIQASAQERESVQRLCRLAQSNLQTRETGKWTELAGQAQAAGLQAEKLWNLADLQELATKKIAAKMQAWTSGLEAACLQQAGQDHLTQSLLDTAAEIQTQGVRQNVKALLAQVGQAQVREDWMAQLEAGQAHCRAVEGQAREFIDKVQELAQVPSAGALAKVLGQLQAGAQSALAESWPARADQALAQAKAAQVQKVGELAQAAESRPSNLPPGRRRRPCAWMK